MPNVTEPTFNSGQVHGIVGHGHPLPDSGSEVVIGFTDAAGTYHESRMVVSDVTRKELNAGKQQSSCYHVYFRSKTRAEREEEEAVDGGS